MSSSFTNFVLFLLLLVECFGLKDKDNYKDQHCTDPRTMAKHGAYTEWADAYSCTRHRCQPGGKSLAIYTVGCKRVEAPESAIECEEVVEDTNMQFPYCCTRLRCLVVVRGEVWTKVFGQPWEVLPAAPWSHMYKMKKPPPSDREFVDKPIAAGPVYEIGSDLDTAAAGYNSDKETHNINMRAKSSPRRDEDFSKMRRSNSAPPPDIVIALETNNNNNEYQDHKKSTGTRSKRPRAQAASQPALAPEYTEDTEVLADKKDEDEEQFAERDHAVSLEAAETNYKPSNLQDLVDAIGTRMRDIENVVQKMADKVPKKKSDADRRTVDVGIESKRVDNNVESQEDTTKKWKPKKTATSGDAYKRFSLRKRGETKYVKRANPDVTSEGPLYVEDRVNGYYSDSANLLVRKEPKEPVQSTYMAPVDSRRKAMQYQTETHIPMNDADLEREQDSKRKKHGHKKRRNKTARNHRRQRKDKRKLNKIGSIEADRNIVSIEDGGSVSHVIL